MALAIEVLVSVAFRNPVFDSLSSKAELDSWKSIWNMVRHREIYRDVVYSSNDRSSDSMGDNAHLLRICLSQTHEKLCKDDRDHVYGMLAMLPDPSGTRIQPDYTKTVPQVYSEFAARYLRPEMLFLAGTSRLAVTPGEVDILNDDYLPSWVPDLRRKRQSWAPLIGNDYHTSLEGDTGLSILQPPFKGLTISGGIFDTIRGRLDVLVDGTVPEDAVYLILFFNIFNALNDIKHDFQGRSGTIYPNMEPFYDALGFTLLAGCIQTTAGNELRRVLEGLSQPALSANGQLMWKEWVMELWSLFNSYCLQPTGEVFQSIVLKMLGYKPEAEIELSRRGKIAWKVYLFIWTLLCRHSLILTQQGYIGLGPRDCKSGDLVAVFNGCKTPFIIRLADTHPFSFSPPAYHLVAPCFVHGIMLGEMYWDIKYVKSGRWKYIVQKVDGKWKNILLGEQFLLV
jgi:hypothetical protein